MRAGALLVYGVVMTAATHWPRLDRYGLASWVPSHADKVVHAALYAGWTVLAWSVVVPKKDRATFPRVAFLLMLAAGWAALDELTQAWVARTVSLWDFVADMVGVGATAAVLAARRYHRHV